MLDKTRVKSHSQTIVCVTRSKVTVKDGKFYNGSMQFIVHHEMCVIHSMHYKPEAALSGWIAKLKVIHAELLQLAFHLKQKQHYVSKKFLEPIESTSTAIVASFYGPGKKEEKIVSFFSVSSCTSSVRLLISYIGIKKSIGILNSMAKEIDSHIETLEKMEICCD